MNGMVVNMAERRVCCCFRCVMSSYLPSVKFQPVLSTLLNVNMAALRWKSCSCSCRSCSCCLRCCARTSTGLQSGRTLLAQPILGWFIEKAKEPSSVKSVLVFLICTATNGCCPYWKVILRRLEARMTWFFFRSNRTDFCSPHLYKCLKCSWF